MILLAVNWAHVWMVTLLGFALVFCLLVILVYTLKGFGYIMLKAESKGNKNTKVVENVTPAVSKLSVSKAAPASDEAAIAMALHLYFAEKHDVESYKLTIRHNGNSTWASKVFGINKLEK